MPSATKDMTKTELLEVLQDIANYMLPVYTFDGKKYVPVENAKFLRSQARQALGMKDE